MDNSYKIKAHDGSQALAWTHASLIAGQLWKRSNKDWIVSSMMRESITAINRYDHRRQHSAPIPR
jgi:hypothetical protein